MPKSGSSGSSEAISRQAKYGYFCISQYTGDLGRGILGILGILGFWGFGVGREVNLVVGGLELGGQRWIGLAQRVGKYPVVNAFSRD